MRNIFFTIFLLGLLNAAIGQEAKTQKVSFFGYQTVEVPAVIYLRTGAEKFTRLELPGANTTNSIQIVNVKGGFGIFGAPTTNAEGEEIYPRLGRVKCDPNWPRAFAIVSSIKKNETVVFSGHAFPMSNNDFPDGSLKFANLSPALVRGKLGEQQVTFRPGEIATIKFDAPPGELIDVIFQYKEKKGAHWARMISTRWPVPETGRRLMFVFPDPKGKGMRAKTIPIRNDERNKE